MNLKKIYYALPNKIRNYVNLKLNPILGNMEEKFINSNSGKKYGLNKYDRINIVNKITNILKNIDSATNINVHLALINAILEIPTSAKESYLVEAGCYYGATSCSISIAAKILNKKLRLLFRSFSSLLENLPKSYNRLFAFLHEI
jgi:hypothetical protein